MLGFPRSLRPSVGKRDIPDVTFRATTGDQTVRLQAAIDALPNYGTLILIGDFSTSNNIYVSNKQFAQIDFSRARLIVGGTTRYSLIVHGGTVDRATPPASLGATETVGTDISAGMAATPFTISVSDSWDAVEVTVNGVSNETINWRARLSAVTV